MIVEKKLIPSETVQNGNLHVAYIHQWVRPFVAMHAKKLKFQCECKFKLKLNGLERDQRYSTINDEAINVLDLKICVMNKYRSYSTTTTTELICSYILFLLLCNRSAIQLQRIFFFFYCSFAILLITMKCIINILLQ